MTKIAVIDFETTGLSPAYGDRATEVAVVMVEDDKIVDRYQSLMNAGKRIPAYIQQLTGISDAMIRKAPPSAQVMHELAEFVGDTPFIAHNAAFDSKFIDAEWSRIQHQRRQDFACSLMLSRRIYPHVHNHKLITLVQSLQLPTSGKYHRALADAEMTAHLIIAIRNELQEQYRLANVPHALLCLLQKTPKTGIAKAIQQAQKSLDLLVTAT